MPPERDKNSGIPARGDNSGLSGSSESVNGHTDAERKDSTGVSNEHYWTTVSISSETQLLLDNLIADTGITSKNQLIQTLIKLGKLVSTGSDIEPASLSEADLDLVADSDVQLEGFQVSTDSKTYLLGFSEFNDNVIIQTAPEPDSFVQPLARTQYTQAQIYCPACGGQIGEYELTSLYPSVDTNVFTGGVWQCVNCESARPHYTLFAARPDTVVPADILTDAMQSYMAHVLIGDTVTKKEFTERVDHCHQLMQDGGWELLPDASKWIGFQATGGQVVTPSLYTEFFATYIEYQLHDAVGVSTVDARTFSAVNDVESVPSGLGVQIDFDYEDTEQVTQYISDLFTTWESTTAEVTIAESASFASQTVRVSFPDMEGANENQPS